MTGPPRARLLLPVVAAACGLTVALAQGPARGTRQLLNDLSSPAIDRGLRDADPPRPLARGADVEGAGDTSFAAGSVVVKFRPGTSPAARTALALQVDGAVMAAEPWADFSIVAIGDDTDPEAAARRLAAQPDVAYAQARYRVRPLFTPNDPLYQRQWNFPLLDMERAWDINPGAAPAITVAVLDTGLAYRGGLFRFDARAFRVIGGPTFPALGSLEVPFAAAPDLGAERIVAPRDFIWNDVTPLDFDGHGTHVTGTIGQRTNNAIGGAGMAFNVRLMPVKVVDTDWDIVFGSPAQGTDDVVARGIRYAVDHGARSLNLSLGRSGPASPVLREALLYAVSRGAFVAVAAGNGFLNGNPTQRPADLAETIDGVVAVGAIGRDRLRARYSSTGSYVELAAPGGDQVRGGTEAGILQQTFDPDMVETFRSGVAAFGPPRFDTFTYEYLQGTSMAAPHVAGLAALLMLQGITSPAAIEAAMKRYATDLGAAGRDNEYGYGLVNPRATLRGLGLSR